MTNLERVLLCSVAWTCSCVSVDDEPAWRHAAVDVTAAPLETDGEDESDDSSGDAFGDASPPGNDAFPESGECGYHRPVQGEHNGNTVYGYPVLEQDNCPSDRVCGRPALDGCTDQNTEYFTCGCVPLETSCDPATIAAGLASPHYDVRADSEARANECCIANDFPQWIDRLATAVDGLQPASPEAAQRWENIHARCEPVCAATFWRGMRYFDGPSFGDPIGCTVTRACRDPYISETTPHWNTSTCSCACELPVGPPFPG